MKLPRPTEYSQFVAGAFGAILGGFILDLIFGYLLAWGSTLSSLFVGYIVYLPVLMILGAYLGWLSWLLKLNRHRVVFWIAFLAVPITWYFAVPLDRHLINMFSSNNLWIVRFPIV